MTNWEICARAINNPGLKIKCLGWAEDEYIFYKDWGWFDSEGAVSHPSFSGDNIVWSEYKEPKKMITWYRPRVVWWRQDDKPEYVNWQFSKTRYSKELVGSNTYKILEWQEITAPEKFEDIE